MTCWMGSSNHHLAKFVGLAPCESEDKIFLIYYMIEVSRNFVGGVLSFYISTLLSLWGSYEIRNNGVGNVSSNSNSNSNAEVPMPRFTNRYF